MAVDCDRPLVGRRNARGGHRSSRYPAASLRRRCCGGGTGRSGRNSDDRHRRRGHDGRRGSTGARVRRHATADTERLARRDRVPRIYRARAGCRDTRAGRARRTGCAGAPADERDRRARRRRAHHSYRNGGESAATCWRSCPRSLPEPRAQESIDIILQHAEHEAYRGGRRVAERWVDRTRYIASSGSDIARVALLSHALGATTSVSDDDRIELLRRASKRGTGTRFASEGARGARTRGVPHRRGAGLAATRPHSPTRRSRLRVGSGDASTLAFCLLAKHDTEWRPGSVQRRLELADEIVELEREPRGRSRAVRRVRRAGRSAGRARVRSVPAHRGARRERPCPISVYESPCDARVDGR